MLDRLPTELLLQVLRILAPLDYTPSLYVERRAFLRRCCLLSKRLCDVAQPMLPEVFEVNGRTTVLQNGYSRSLAPDRDDVYPCRYVEALSVVSGDCSRGARVRVMALRGQSRIDEKYSNDLFKERDLKRLMEICPALKSLILVGLGNFELEWLRPLSGLRFLTISGQTYFISIVWHTRQVLPFLTDDEPVVAPPLLPCLLELSIDRVALSSAVHPYSDFPSFLHTPSLKLLATRDAVESPSDLFDDLPSLKAYSVDPVEDVLQHMGTSGPLVVDLDIYLGSAEPLKKLKQLPPALRLCAPALSEAWYTYADSIHAFIDFAQFLVGLPASSPLRLVILPDFSNLYKELDSTQAFDLRAAVCDVERACAAKGIKVDFEEAEDGEEYRSLITAAFRRCARQFAEER